MESMLVTLLLGPLLSQSSPQSCPLGAPPPGRAPVRFAPQLVHADHSTPTIAADGSEVYWAQREEEGAPRRILVSRLAGERWSQPRALPFTLDSDGDCPVLAPDGKTLFFNSTRPLPGEEAGRRERIWLVTRQADGWSEPMPVGPAVNAGHLHWQVSVDREGNLYFGSERAGTLGRDDLFLAPRSPSGLEEPRPLPAPVNTPSHESTPFIAPDGDYLLFVRSHHGDGEPPYPTGLLASFRRADGGWTDPVRVRLEGEAGENAVCPFVSRDGRYLFFLVLTRSEKSVYWVDAAVIRELDPRGR